MQKLFIYIILAICGFSASAETWFPYPTAPESLPIGRPRANYLVEHFWDRCPWKSAYSSRAKMQQTLTDYADYLPIAAPDTVFASINTLIKNTQKKPADFETLMNMTEAVFYSDTSEYRSEQIYLPFAQAGATFKKFKPAQRAVYERQARIIENSMEGNPVPHLEVTDMAGNKSFLNDTVPGVETYILFFERPEAGRMDRVLFAGNVSANKLVEAGLVQPVLVCAGQPDEAWRESTTRLPEGWRAVALPDAENQMDLKMNPSIYLADKSMNIISKLMPLSLLRINCEQLVKNIGL